MTDLGSNAPVWWDKEVDAAGRPIRLDVRGAAHQIWDAARRQAQHLLGDASEAPELMENAVAQVSRYLDRSGAELKSESKMYCSPIPTYFVLDHPYLIFLRQRGAQAPYFAMWVDNSELLSNWQKETSVKPSGAMNVSQPIRSETNRTSAAAGSTH